jgi:hypothetical protein
MGVGPTRDDPAGAAGYSWPDTATGSYGSSKYSTSESDSETSTASSIVVLGSIYTIGSNDPSVVYRSRRDQ